MIKQHTLDNGLRVVMEALPFVRSVSFGIWVRNGSRNESQETNGISHFIEHMMFKGTETRSARDIADTMDAVGGQINAYTSKEHTCYFTRTLDTHFDTALEVLTDMFFRSAFDPAEIQKERNVILEEINMYEDTPEDLAFDMQQYSVWPRDPLGLTILGKAETISGFEKEDLLRYLNTHYTPQNTVISIAGNIDEEDALNKITKAFGGFRANTECLPPVCSVPYTPAFITKEKDIEQAHLCLGFPGVPAGADESYAMAAVNAIFGGGMSSRLFQKIREEHGLVYSVYSTNAAFSDTGLFTVYAALNPAQIYDVMRLIVDEIKRMFSERVTEEQLKRAKEQLKSGFLLSLESAANRMNSIGRSMLMLNRIITADELIKKIDAVNRDSFYSLCDKVFQLDKMSISLVGKDMGKLSAECFQ